MARRFLGLVLVLWCAYNANRRELGLADSVPTTLLAVSLVQSADLDLDEFEAWLGGDEATRLGVEWTGAVTRVGEHWRSAYPVGGAFLAAPVFAAGVWLFGIDDFTGYRLLGKLSASLMVALSAGLLWLILLRPLDPRPALGWTLVYALGTGAFSVASQALWQHGPSLLCISLAVWAQLRLQERPGRSRALLLGAALGAAVVCRPLNAIALLGLGGLALWQRPRLAPFLVLPAAAFGALLLHYNLSVFGDLGGGYMAVVRSPAMQQMHHLTRDNLFDFPLARGLAGVLFAPNKGALAYSPVLALAPLGILRALREPRTRALGVALLLWCAGMLWVMGTLRTWWGGTAFGSRYFCELLVPWFLFLALAWPALARRPGIRAAVGALALYGVAVQWLGALTWDCGWAFEPMWAEVVHERFWDLHDTEVGRCAGQLLQQGPRPADF